MRVALIAVDGKALPVGRELRRRNHEVTLVVPQTEERPSTPDFVRQWQAEGFAWLPVSAARLTPRRSHYPRDASLATARALSGVLRAFDVAWFFESHWAMPTCRDRRFRDRALPVVVLERAAEERIPGSIEEINRASSRQYAMQWADLIGSVEDVDRLPALFRERAAVRPIPHPLSSPAVTICIPYFEEPEFLPLALESLARQTSNDFTVVVVDDGSHSAKAREVFAACARQYASRGWKFLTQSNQFPGAARNNAARQATSELLLFFDADDIAVPAMVERFVRAAMLTGDDCLVAPMYTFADDPEGPCPLLFDPPGSLVGSMCDDMVGGIGILIRRDAFWSMGGFTELRGIGFEDYELHVRCLLEGLRWDVLPELVYRYRKPRGGGVSQSTNLYPNQARVLRHYEKRLRDCDLGRLPLALASAHWRKENAGQAMEEKRRVLALRLGRMARQLRLLLLTCYFPYGTMTGWHRRVQEMIRYFGSRYQLTLVTQMTREQLSPVRKEAFRYLRFIRGVEGSDRPAGGKELPVHIRNHYSDKLQAALRAIPTDHYHAAFFDQIFTAELRHDIDTLPVLTEHNIESRLLRQAAERHQQPMSDALELERYEDRVWPEFPLRAVVSDLDREQMAARVTRGRTVVAANGADPSSWLPDVRRDHATVLFPAQLGYLPNVDAVELLLNEIWPRVRKANPRTKLILAGREPAEAVKHAAARAEGVELCVNPPVMDVIARRASLTVAPLRLGSGTRNKILESMAWGLPVVSTTLGAEGIDAFDGEHLLLRDDPETFAEAILELLADEALWQKLRHTGSALVRERYSWDRVFEPLEAALLELIP
jgi:glycosyltransferase involved in cell wall biosynthesis/GT2 family glycosyltransferase